MPCVNNFQLLPPTADIYNYIYDGGGSGRLDNVIRFYKSWVVKSVRAVTKYRVRSDVLVYQQVEGKAQRNSAGYRILLCHTAGRGPRARQTIEYALAKTYINLHLFQVPIFRFCGLLH